jgi:hypothetical protein
VHLSPGAVRLLASGGLTDVTPYGETLADGIEAALPGWVQSSVGRIMHAWSGGVPDPVRAAAEEAGRRAQQELGPQIRELLIADIDEQRSTPLAMLRSAGVRYPTEVLRAAGVPPIERDSFAERAFPEDLYDLAPASFSDLTPELQDAGLAWGAAKAFEHKRRHQP